jgi:hypothetical protein
MALIRMDQRCWEQVMTRLSIQHLLWLALALALFGSLRHLAAMFAAVDGNLFTGYLSAIAVDVGLFAISYSIKTRKAARRPVRFLWLGIVLFTIISVYGNYAYGLSATGGTLPAWIVASRPVIMAASLPVLVLYLAELISDNQQYDLRVAKRVTKTVTNGPSVTKMDKPNEAKTAKLTNRRDKIRSLLAEQMTPEDIAGQMDVSVRTVRRDIEALNGQMVR